MVPDWRLPERGDHLTFPVLVGTTYPYPILGLLFCITTFVLSQNQFGKDFFHFVLLYHLSNI